MEKFKGLSGIRLLLIGIIVLALGIAPGIQAQNDNGKKPIQTKSGRRAAIKAAAAAASAAPANAPTKKTGSAASTFGVGSIQALAMPASPTDETRVPHYFGPFPNWATSPLTLADAQVSISGDGSGAEATATVGANGAVTGVTITNPGSGYTTATVNISGGGSGAAAAAVVTRYGAVTNIKVDDGGSGYTAPQVIISDGGFVRVGNSLIPRSYATDSPTPLGSLAPIFVVVPTTMPAAGVVQSIQYFNQATNGASPTSSAGNLFHAYVLQLAGNNTYRVRWDSGLLTVPTTTDPVGVIETIPVPNIPVTTGDAIAFYGEGIPLDVGGGTDVLSYPVNAPPALNLTISVGNAPYSIYSQDRTYSFAANILTYPSMRVGNSLIPRSYATDSPTPLGSLAPIFVVLPTTMPASGIVNSIQYFNQATNGGSPRPSAGNLFHAYVLHLTGNNTYNVLWDSGELTVPATADPVGVIETIPVPNISVTTGDAIAFYGSGIPIDVGSGADVLCYQADVPPVLDSTISVGNAPYPIYPQARTYSIATNVFDTSYSPPPLINATATPYGGVDAIRLTTPGSGYTFPTVDFDMPDGPDGVKAVAHAEMNGNGAITAIVVDQPGSGYSFAPNVVIRDGTVFDPIRDNAGTGASATASLLIQNIVLDTFGSGYLIPPTVNISDPTGTNATATAEVNAGAVTAINLTAAGSGYITPGGIRKFQDTLPGLTPAGENNLGQYIPVAVPDTTTFSQANGFAQDADYYVIGVVQHREQMHSDLPPTLMRKYVQLSTDNVPGRHVALRTALLDGTTTPTLMPDGTQAYGVDDPHFLGPIISATKDKAVRIVFYNLLPKNHDGDLFLPTDSTIMGSGPGPVASEELFDPLNQGTVMDAVRNPACTEYPKSEDCFKDNRATLHLHGGITPWISDGTPHQWITPADESTPYPEGVSVGNVPDMASEALEQLGVPDCTAENDGCQTFYYTNQQSARLMFYHDHAWGITRLNVYAGEAAGYLISDPIEQALVANGTIPSDQIPLVIQDRTFVPDAQQLSEQDPTWDSERWGGYGNFWYHHVYMPAQNPGDPSGMSAYGRWMYGPWFWPPATPPNGPIANPYYTGTCNLDDPNTWQYDTDPFCEPELIPGTPNISVGMEQFNDTPLVNGTVYPTTTLQPKSYRLRILNAANDRFWNLQWYVADPRTGTDSEVALNPAELAAAQLDPVLFPTPDTSFSPAGPDWIVIGSEGGFLPAPVVVPAQPITWNIDPTTFNVGNVDQHSLLMAPAERFDVIVDFSKYAGKTLILYNDAPAAFPARVSTYDYYTGGPDLSPNGAPTILPGYGPNTRTIMQVKIAAATPAAAFDLYKLQQAFGHKADGSGAFESAQHPIIVGQAGYNSAYGTDFAASGNCNDTSASQKCDGMLRIDNQGGTLFGFNTLLAPTQKLQIPIEPKAIHDEMNSASFDEFGRMTANIGLEVVPATPALQNIVLYPYPNPPTEIIDGTSLPKQEWALNGIEMTPISSIASADGTQIWKITHNGVDTHPLHFHLYDVQVLNRVSWDNIVAAPHPTELGWKETLRVSPLEDTIVALRPIVPDLPFELPNSIRPLHPMMPLGETLGFNNTDVNGIPTAPITNQLVNFGWEYVWHCHILSHEEMDMMRPVSVALPPTAPSGLSHTTSEDGLRLQWNDNSIIETSFLIQRDSGSGYVNVGTVQSPLDIVNTKGTREYLDTTYQASPGTYVYRVVAQNMVGYGAGFPSKTATSVSNELTVGASTMPAAPTNLALALLSGPQIRLTWTDQSTNETGFIVQRSTTGGAPWTQVGATLAANSVTFTDTSVSPGVTYTYRVGATNATGTAFSNTAQFAVPNVPGKPSITSLIATRISGTRENVRAVWSSAAGATSYRVQWSQSNWGPVFGATSPLGASTTNYTVRELTRGTWYFRVGATNTIGTTWSDVVSVAPAQ